jgi:hypothetical protein
MVANLLDGSGRYGYQTLRLAPLASEKIALLPLGSSPRSVKPWAARYFDFGKQAGLRVGFEAASQDTFRVRLVAIRSGSPQVLEAPLAAGRGEVRGIRADRVVAMVSRRGGASNGGGFLISADPFQPSPAALCDFDGDGTVGFGDFFLFADGFGKSSGTSGFNPLFDLDGDGVAGLEDFFQFALQFGLKSSP